MTLAEQPMMIVGSVLGLILAYGIVSSLLRRREGEGIEIFAERTGQRITAAFRGIFTTARVAVFTAFSVLMIALQEGSHLLGEVGWYVGEVPVLASNVVAAGLGYLTIRGDLALGATEYAILVMVGIGIGVVIDKS
jgi:ATP/ADP translocase